MDTYHFLRTSFTSSGVDVCHVACFATLVWSLRKLLNTLGQQFSQCILVQDYDDVVPCRFHYTMMAWLPSYFADTLSLNLSQAAQLSLLPPVAAIVASSIAGTAGDALISKGMPVVQVRKLAQCTAFLGPAMCLAGASLTDGSHLKVGKQSPCSFATQSQLTVFVWTLLLAASCTQHAYNTAKLAAQSCSMTFSSPSSRPLTCDWWSAALITGGLGLASFSLAGLYCNHADLSPRYAPVLLGLTNTSAAIPGIIGVTITGAILDKTGSWPLALFAPSIAFFVTGSAVFAAWGSSDQQSFENNSPFAVEKYAQPLYSGLHHAKRLAGGVKAQVPKLDQQVVKGFVSQVYRIFKQKQI